MAHAHFSVDIQGYKYTLRICNSYWFPTTTMVERKRLDVRLRLKCDGTRAETRFGLSAKRTSPFKSTGASVQSTAGSRGVRFSGSNAGYTMFRGGVRVLATHPIRHFPLHYPFLASPCAIRFQLDSTLYVHCLSCLPSKQPALFVWSPLRLNNVATFWTYFLSNACQFPHSCWQQIYIPPLCLYIRPFTPN